MSSSTMSSSIPSIPEFYRDKCIFITGATGFMGKALIEKLLRSCPDIKTLYLLVRPKKGKEPEQRIEEIISSKVIKAIKEFLVTDILQTLGSLSGGNILKTMKNIYDRH